MPAPACDHFGPLGGRNRSVGLARAPLENLEPGSEAEGLEIVKGRPQKDKMELAPGATPVHYLSPLVPGLAVEAPESNQAERARMRRDVDVAAARLAPD